MGTGDRSDPTTDFFDTHRAQCLTYAKKLRSVASGASGVVELVAKLDEAVVECDAAIANGRSRTEQPPIVVKMPMIISKYDGDAAESEDRSFRRLEAVTDGRAEAGCHRRQQVILRQPPQQEG